MCFSQVNEFNIVVGGASTSLFLLRRGGGGGGRRDTANLNLHVHLYTHKYYTFINAHNNMIQRKPFLYSKIKLRHTITNYGKLDC